MDAEGQAACGVQVPLLPLLDPDAYCISQLLGQNRRPHCTHSTPMIARDQACLTLEPAVSDAQSVGQLQATAMQQYLSGRQQQMSVAIDLCSPVTQSSLHPCVC